jgi:alpha-L-rhamnosidase
MHGGVPTDCPHREKLPYTGDGQCTAKSVFYSFGFENFYDKWLTDIVDSQGENGFEIVI